MPAGSATDRLRAGEIRYLMASSLSMAAVKPASDTGLVTGLRLTDSMPMFRLVPDFIALTRSADRGVAAAEELAVTSWTDAQKAAFLDMQFQAQHAHYIKHYPEADRLVVERAGLDIGRLYVERWPSQHRIIDIAFLPDHRRKGYGTALLRDLIDEAWLAGKSASIHVEKNNPARQLYLELGFVVVEDKGVYDLMACAPPADGAGVHLS
jgi:GNAT superfamily N-acetyltransferase